MLFFTVYGLIWSTLLKKEPFFSYVLANKKVKKFFLDFPLFTGSERGARSPDLRVMNSNHYVSKPIKSPCIILIFNVLLFRDGV